MLCATKLDSCAHNLFTHGGQELVDRVKKIRASMRLIVTAHPTEATKRSILNIKAPPVCPVDDYMRIATAP